MTVLAEKLQTLRRELREEYLQPHDWPWMIGFSGGKDSTLILHLVIECLEPLADFRKRLKSVSEDPDSRSKTRRNGMPGLGPLTMEARRALLDELLAVQASVGTELISSLEVRLIREQWLQDEFAAMVKKRTLPELKAV